MLFTFSSANALLIASSHSHFSGPTHQSPSMGLPSIMNVAPMNTPPAGSSSGYALPPIPQAQPPPQAQAPTLPPPPPAVGTKPAIAATATAGAAISTASEGSIASGSVVIVESTGSSRETDFRPAEFVAFCCWSGDYPWEGEYSSSTTANDHTGVGTGVVPGGDFVPSAQCEGRADLS